MDTGAHQRILVTGGAGFIGSHLILRLVQEFPQWTIHNLDALTYAADLTPLIPVSQAPNYHFHHLDITDVDALTELWSTYPFDAVIHLAAESHVDRSIQGPEVFLTTNVQGTLNLLTLAIKHWKDQPKKRFHHISTDEVYGSLGSTGYFTEQTPYAPNSPYAASKASADHWVRAYAHTFGLNAVITNCSNNYGPHQHPEKLIPLSVERMSRLEPVPLYGDGLQVRDWLHVSDHVEGIIQVFLRAEPGSQYVIGGRNEWKNKDLLEQIATVVDRQLARPMGTSAALITPVQDRPGHDRRYAIDPQKIENELGWAAQKDLPSGLEETVAWCLKRSQSSVNTRKT